MDYFVFSKISGYYLLINENVDGVNARTGLFFPATSVESIFESETCNGAILNDLFDHKISFTQAQYSISRGENYLLLLPVGKPMFRRRQFAAAAIDARHRVTEFELARKEKLIHSINAIDMTLEDYVNAWAEYFFFDHYSLWIYNKFTKAFTCSISSFEYPRNVIFEDEQSSLNAVLEEDYKAENREPNENHQSQNEIGGIRTVSRMKLAVGYDGTIGALTLYSQRPDFKLEQEGHLEVSNSIQAKYLQVRQHAHQAMYQINQQFIEAYETGLLDQFLFRIVCQVSKSFQVEACSVFLVDESRQYLKLIATSDNQIQGEPENEYSYPVADDSPTTEVFRNEVLAFSYDLASDDPNNDGYNESTDHAPQNWIGVPLTSAGQCFGVLRVRNKFSETEAGDISITQFSTGDFMNLLALSSNLANLVRIESLFVETEEKLATTNASIKEMNDFNKVFLHEIRTPISKFTMAPEIIKRTLRNKELSEQNLEKVMRQLDDIQVMGDRLEFIAKTFNFNQIVTRRNFETLSVLRDVIFPVINITRAYLRKQYDIDIQLDAVPLQSSRVYGDKTLLNIVFNTLIDNAGKYSVGTRMPITVSGGYEQSGEYFNISVSNYGLPIHEDEAETLFKKGERGREAIKQGIGGTGIGLHLAQRIMTEGNGNLLLTSTSDPVTFTIRVPARAPGKK